MMDRQSDIEELLCDYIDGTLVASRRQQAESLLAQDAELRKMVAEMTRAKGMLKEFPADKAPPELTRSIRHEIETPPRTLRWPMPFALRLAASLLLTATVAVVIWAALPSGRQSPIAARAPEASGLSPGRSMERDATAFDAVQAPAVAITPAPAATAPVIVAAKESKKAEGGLDEAQAVATPAQSPSVPSAASPAIVAAPAPSPAPPVIVAAADDKKAKDRAVAAEGMSPRKTAASTPGLPVVPQGLILAEAPQVIIVRASDIPAVQREIDAMLGASNVPVLSNASPSYAASPRADALARNAGKSRGVGNGGDKQKSQQSQATPPIAPTQSLADRDAAQEMPTPASVVGATAYRGTASNSIVIRNISPEQMQMIRDDLLALGNRRRIEVVDQTFAAALEQRQERQMLQQNQLMRTMPSAQPAELQAARQMMRQTQDSRQQVGPQDVPAKLDLTIEFQQLPPAGKPATLPASRPGQASPSRPR